MVEAGKLDLDYCSKLNIVSKYSIDFIGTRIGICEFDSLCVLLTRLFKDA